VTCVCGVTHRTATHCAVAERITSARAHAQRVVDALSALPPDTIAVVDARSGKASGRTLGTVTQEIARVVRSQLGGTAATTDSTDGTVVSYGRVVGGFVADYYGHPAETDELLWASRAGRTVVVLARVRAQPRPEGRGVTVDRLLYGGSAERVLREGARHDARAVLAELDPDSLTPALAVRRDQLLETGAHPA